MNKYNEWDYEPLSVDELNKTEIGRWSLALDADNTPLLSHMKSKQPPIPTKDVKGTHPYLYRVAAPVLRFISRACRWVDRVQGSVEGWAANRYHDIQYWPDHKRADFERYYQEHPEMKKAQWGLAPIKPFEMDTTNYPDA